MINLIFSIIKLIWVLCIEIPISLTWKVFCTVIWIMWSLIFGFSIGARPVDVGPFRMQ